MTDPPRKNVHRSGMRPVAVDVVDRSRAGHLVHDATSQGRTVYITAYIEGLQGDQPRYMITSTVTCRTSEQAAEMARVLKAATT